MFLKICCTILLFSSSGIFAENDAFALADFCPASYAQARQAFIDAASHNPLLCEQSALPIAAKGPNNGDLSIDIAVLGNLVTAKNILFHISGTHGVECGAGSGIQRAFLSDPPLLPEDTAIVLIHALNPFGMAWNRRVNEKNIDLNRNCHVQRKTSHLYGIIDPLINPKEPIPWNSSAFQHLCAEHGWPAIKTAIAEGQYDFPEGLFYGGSHIAEGPELVFAWCRSHLSIAHKDARFGIIDVHSGLGPYACDTLLTIDPPNDCMLAFFGEKMAMETQMTTAGYPVTGIFMSELAHCIQAITHCGSILLIGQEFGTTADPDALSALYDENALFHHALRTGSDYDPDNPAALLLRQAFYPEDREWRHRVVSLGHSLLLQTLAFLENF